MTVTHPVTIVAADHPSLDGAVTQFLDDLGQSATGRLTSLDRPTATSTITDLPTLATALAHGPRHGGGFRLAAVDRARVVGLARVDRSGDLLVAVAADRRGQGIGSTLSRAVVQRARVLGCSRLSLRSSRRSRAATAMATAMGFMVVDRGRGRLDIVLDLAPRSHSA